MRRRAFIIGSAAVSVAPYAGARAQVRRKPYRIGYLYPGSEASTVNLLEAFRAGMRELGHVEGEGFILDRRYADGDFLRLPGLAVDLVNQDLDLILTASMAGAEALMRATGAIPIVFATMGDPVATGFVQSLARPGGNITGLSNLGPDLTGKRLEILKETMPRLAKLAIVYNRLERFGAALRVPEAERAAARLGFSIRPVGIGSVPEMNAALAGLAREAPDAVYVVTDSLVRTTFRRIVEFALRNRVATLFEDRDAVELGALMSFGANLATNYRRAALYVDRILKGAKPADLPVEQPTTFELVVNLKTAQAIGVTIPNTVLLRADEVIE